MGIEPFDLPFFLAEARRLPFTGAALAVGGGALGQAAAAATFADFGLPAPASTSLPDLLRVTGFAKVEVAPDLASGMDRSDLFGTVFDLSASMRAFHVRRALAALGQRVAVGGRIVHAVPSANHMDQGFYMASPRLFHDYYRVNKWRIDELLLVRCAPNGRSVEAVSYTPGSLRGVAHGGLDDARYRVFCVATRMSDSTVGLVPQHGFYADAWMQGAVPGPAPSRKASAPASWLRNTRWAYAIVHALTAARKHRNIRTRFLPFSVRYRAHSTAD